MNYHMREQATSHAPLDLSGTFIRRTDLSGANLENADLSEADCAFVNFAGANFKGTNLFRTNLRGADLTGARNLTREQIQSALIDAKTILPIELR
jgi:uncharacterized protein YjbI with pentapeptide repeats